MSTQHQSLTSKVFDLFQYEKVLQNSTIGFLLLLQLQKMREEAHLFIQEGRMASSRRAHQVEGCGLPSVRARAPLLHIHQTHVNQKPNEGEGATSLNTKLPPQEGATSPRGAHLSNSRSSNQEGSSINQHPIT